jgi:uncharacterized protein (DUF952 family)
MPPFSLKLATPQVPLDSVAPFYLYKLLSVENWRASQGCALLQLPKEDEAFIHFSTKEQLPRLEAKYWASTSYYLLEVISTQLIGRLIYEANAVGGQRYYHLYDGFIPLSAIASAQFIDKRSGDNSYPFT